MLAIYRSPVGKINNFVSQLDIILQTLHNPSRDHMCDYINVNYLNDNRKSQLDALKTLTVFVVQVIFLQELIVILVLLMIIFSLISLRPMTMRQLPS